MLEQPLERIDRPGLAAAQLHLHDEPGGSAQLRHRLNMTRIVFLELHLDIVSIRWLERNA